MNVASWRPQPRRERDVNEYNGHLSLQPHLPVSVLRRGALA